MSRRCWSLVAWLSLAAGVMVACQDESTRPTPPSSVRDPPVRVSNFAISPNENNVLSVIATFDTEGADSVRVVYLADSGASGATPFVAPAAPGRVVVLGLRPASSYRALVEVRGADTVVTSDTVALTTDSLPAFLQATHLDSDVPASGGYVLTAVGDSTTAYAVAFDSTGAVAWYRAFAEGVPAGEIKQQTNGDITVFLGATHGAQPVPGRYVELGPDGDVVRTIAAKAPAYTDNHELWLLFRDSVYDGAVYVTYTQRHLDLSADGGSADTVLSGHQIVRVDADGRQHVLFDAWDHFSPGDNVEPVPGEGDFDHPNAIDIAPDGNYLVSWRNLDAITKIDSATGEILWTLASPFSTLPSDFTIAGDPLDGFSAQHSVRATGPDAIMLFDNGTRHEPSMSRALEYQLDDGAKTATMMWEFRHSPPFYTLFTGSVQRLANGNTLIGWTWPGNPLAATEVAPDGQVVWEGTLHSPGGTSPYRFTRIASLYRYDRP